jgi:hypothetical protein
MANSESNSIEERLRLLGQTTHRTKTSRVGDYLELIIDLKNHGITNNQIVEVLRKEGIDLTLKTFENILHRLMKRKKKNLCAQSPSQASIKSVAHYPQEIQSKNNSLVAANEIATPGDFKRLRRSSHDIAHESIEDL